VFGRTTYPDPLEFQGTLTAADHRQAAGQALERHGRRWVELVLLPEASIHWILGPQPVGPEGSGEPHNGPAGRRSGPVPPTGAGEPEGPEGSGEPQGGAPVDRAPVDREVEDG
jgi:hypothetical protein